MGLIINIVRDSCIPATHFGGITISPEASNFNRQELWHCINAGEAGFKAQSPLPWGNRHPLSWRMALKNGAIASTSNNVSGSGNTSGTLHYGLPLLATIAGQGTISSALANLGVQILATITGIGGVSNAVGSLLAQISSSITASGGISSADARAFLNALAELTGSGEISSAEAEGIGELIAILESSGNIDGTLTGIGELSATIKSYSDLSVEGLRDAIWQAAANRYPDATTMGGKLNLASSGGVDYDALANAILDAILTGHDLNDSLAKTIKDIKKKANIIPGLL
jgi:hypothetical protein